MTCGTHSPRCARSNAPATQPCELTELRQVNEINKATAERFGRALELIADIKLKVFAGFDVTIDAAKEAQ